MTARPQRFAKRAMAMHALLLVICLILIFLWGRSTGRPERIDYIRVGDDLTLSMDAVVSGDGSVGWWISRGGPGSAPAQSAGFRGIEFKIGRMIALELPPGFLGFPLQKILGTDGSGKAYTQWYVTVPYALLILICGYLPARALVRLVRSARRITLGHCRQCGYDLRGSPDRCPECGLDTKAA